MKNRTFKQATNYATALAMARRAGPGSMLASKVRAVKVKTAAPASGSMASVWV